MRWLPKKLKEALDTRAAEIEKQIDAPVVDSEKIDAAIAEMMAARQLHAEPVPARDPAPPEAAPRTGFGRRGL